MGIKIPIFQINRFFTSTMTIINKLEENFPQKSLASLDYRINRDIITFCSKTALEKEDVSIFIDTDGSSNKSYPSVKTTIFINPHLNVLKEQLDFFCFKVNIDIDLFCQQTILKTATETGLKTITL